MEEAYSDKSIDQYLSGELSDVEKDAFEKQLDMDESLRQELEIAVKAKAALYAKAIKSQKETFSSRWQEVKPEQKSQSRKLYYFLAAAAVIGLFLLFNFLKPAPQVSNQELFAQYYETPLASSIRAEGSASSFKKANIAFQQKRYAEAAAFYLEALEDIAFIQRDEAIFFAGISFLELKQTQKALDLFKQLTSEEYLEMKNWYSVLAYLQLDKPDEARTILSSISKNPQHYYYQKAEEILEKLDSF